MYLLLMYKAIFSILIYIAELRDITCQWFDRDRPQIKSELRSRIQVDKNSLELLNLDPY
jgi:hypothetical protein